MKSRWARPCHGVILLNVTDLFQKTFKRLPLGVTSRFRGGQSPRQELSKQKKSIMIDGLLLNFGGPSTQKIVGVFRAKSSKQQGQLVTGVYILNRTH